MILITQIAWSVDSCRLLRKFVFEKCLLSKYSMLQRFHIITCPTQNNSNSHSRQKLIQSFGKER